MRRTAITVLLAAAAVPSAASASAAAPGWEVAKHPDLGPGSALHDVVATDATHAWAVGGEGFGAGDPGRPVILRWDGSAWSRDPLVLPGVAWRGGLHLAAAASSTDVWAAGSVSGATPEDTVTRVLRNTGGGWREVPFPLGNSPSINLFTGLAAVDGQAWLIGNRVSDVVIQHYDGRQWTAQEPPAECRGFPRFCTFTGITAFAPDDVWVAGNAMLPGFLGPLLFHWNGVEWRSVQVGIIQEPYVLTAVDGSSPDDLWAVGNLFNSVQPFVVHGDGKQWKVVPGLADGRLDGLAINAAGRPWVLRNTVVVPSAHLALNNHDGSWTDVDAPLPKGATGSTLTGITAVPGSDTLFAVGNADLPTSPRTATGYIVTYG